MGFQFDYFYGMETRQYKYFVIPQALILDEQFSALSDRAKILYSVMLDRSSMSAKNGWIDDQSKVYIIMTRDEIMEKMNCSHTTAHKLVQELIDFGLIIKRRRGQGKPDWIYVMNFNKLVEEEKEPFLQEGKNPFPQESKNPLPQEGKDSFPELDLYNKTNINKSSSSLSDDDEEYIRQHLGYEKACLKYSKIIVDLLYQELVKRDPAVWDRVTPEAFYALCNNVTNYHGGVANVEAYIARCVDNMLKAAAANIAGHSPPGSKSKNPFKDFQQNNYDFAAIEKELLGNR